MLSGAVKREVLAEAVGLQCVQRGVEDVGQLHDFEGQCTLLVGEGTISAGPKQTDKRQIDRQQADRQTGRQVDMQTGRQIDR
jgi:hypothetical protein